MYQTRHTFATLAIQSGEQIGWVSRQLGHTTDEMVIRHYAKFIPKLTRQNSSALSRVMGEQGLGGAAVGSKLRPKCQKVEGGYGRAPVTP